MPAPKPCCHAPADEVFHVAVRGDETGAYFDQYTAALSAEDCLRRAERTMYRKTPVARVAQVRFVEIEK